MAARNRSNRVAWLIVLFSLAGMLWAAGDSAARAGASSECVLECRPQDRARPAREASRPDEDWSDTRPLWRVQWANDALLRSDNQFTNGISVQKHSALHTELAATDGTPAFGKRIARAFLPEKPGLLYREGWALGHNIQTPGRVEEPALILNDVPYVGMLGLANTFVALNDEELTGFELLLGWVGPSTHGGKLQSAIHDLNGSARPKGWHNQLDDEPLVNFYYSKKRKLWQRPRFDGTFSVDAALGNFFTHGQAALEMRFGRTPPGFAFVPTPIGRGIDLDATLGREPGRAIYGSAVLRGTRLVHALPRQGNTFSSDNPWTENNRMEMEKRVGQLILGLHVEQPRWALHLHFWLSTDTVSPVDLSAEQDPDNSFGVITFERRL